MNRKKFMPRKYSYYPSFDGGGPQPGTEKLVALCAKKWKTKSLGIYQVRLMKNDHTVGMKLSDPEAGKWMSTHATGAAADIQYPSEAIAREMWDFLLNNSEALGVEEAHWYAFGDFGAGFRCSRGEGKSGVKIFTQDDNAGSYQGSPSWLHVEISPSMAKNADKFSKAWDEAMSKPA